MLLLFIFQLPIMSALVVVMLTVIAKVETCVV